MEVTITQIGALYLLDRRTAQKRRAFLRRSRAAADKQSPDIRRYEIFMEKLVGRRSHLDNGR